MDIVLFGDTDKRPIIYTLLKLLQSLGDVALLSNDRHYKRLIGGMDAGELESVFVAVGDYSPDDVFDELDIDKEDFEFVLYDGIVPSDYDVFMYIAGCNKSDSEEYILDCIDDYITVPLGFGDKCIQYTVKMFQSVEEIEGYGMLKEVDSTLTKRLAPILSPIVHMPTNNIRKVVAKKR